MSEGKISMKKADAIYPTKLFFYDCIWEDNKIVFPACGYNVICETDTLTGETTVIGDPIEEKEFPTFLGICRWKEYLILSSCWMKAGIYLLHLKTGEWFCIPMEEKWKGYVDFREENVFECNGYLYIFPSSPVVLKVDMKRRNIDFLFYPDLKLDDDIRGEIAILENVIYIPMRHKNRIYKFNLYIEQWENVNVNIELKGIDTLCYDGRLFWMTGIGQMICSWDEKTNTGIPYKKFPLRFKRLVTREGEEGRWFIKSIAYKDFLYFVPQDANMMIRFHVESGEMGEFFIEGEWEDKEDVRIGRPSPVKYMGAKRKEKMLMMLSNKNKNLIFIDMETGRISKTEIKMSIKGEVDRLISRTSRISEGLVDLEALIKYVSLDEQAYAAESGGQKEMVGKKIYSLC